MTLTPSLIADISNDIEARPAWACLRLLEYQEDNPLLVRILKQKAERRLIERYGEHSKAVRAFEDRDTELLRAVHEPSRARRNNHVVLVPKSYRERKLGGRRKLMTRKRASEGVILQAQLVSQS